MSEAQPIPYDVSTVNLGCFEVARQLYALEVAHIQEIVRSAEVTPLPNAPSLIEGVIDLRRAVIPVVDLATLLGLGIVIQGPRTRIVVLDVDGLVLGLRVDAAIDVLTLAGERLEDVPDLATHAGYDVVRAVIRREGETPIMVLDPEMLLESVYRSASMGAASGGAAS